MMRVVYNDILFYPSPYSYKLNLSSNTSTLCLSLVICIQFILTLYDILQIQFIKWIEKSEFLKNFIPSQIPFNTTFKREMTSPPRCFCNFALKMKLMWIYLDYIHSIYWIQHYYPIATSR